MRPLEIRVVPTAVPAEHALLLPRLPAAKTIMLRARVPTTGVAEESAACTVRSKAVSLPTGLATPVIRPEIPSIIRPLGKVPAETLQPYGGMPPETSKVKSYALPPLVAGNWVVPMMTGDTGAMVNAAAAEVPPPGAGLKTVTWAAPSAAISLAGTAAVTRVLETNVVVRSDPFQRTIDPEMNEEPLTVSVKPTPPVAAAVGEIEFTTGTGFSPRKSW